MTRVPIDATTSGADHFIPGIGVDHATSGSTAKIGHYYFHPNANCSASTCQLEVGYVSSANGDSTWSTAQTVAGPMPPSQIAGSSQGSVVGDSISTSVAGGRSVVIFAVGTTPTNGQAYDEAMSTVQGGLTVNGGPARAEHAQHDTVTHPATGSPRIPLRTAR